MDDRDLNPAPDITPLNFLILLTLCLVQLVGQWVEDHPMLSVAILTAALALWLRRWWWDIVTVGLVAEAAMILWGGFLRRIAQEQGVRPV